MLAMCDVFFVWKLSIARECLSAWVRSRGDG